MHGSTILPQISPARKYCGPRRGGRYVFAARYDTPVGAGFHPRPGFWGGRNSPFCFWLSLRWCCLFHPISLVLPKETGWSPKEKRLWGGGAPVRFRDPPASPTRVGAATRPLRCPLRGRIESLAATARGLGWQKSGPVKVFCPAFLQKSGRGPGAEPWPRAAARGTLLCSQSAGGGQRGNPRRGFPLCGRPKPPAAPAPP